MRTSTRIWIHGGNIPIVQAILGVMCIHDCLIVHGLWAWKIAVMHVIEYEHPIICPVM